MATHSNLVIVLGHDVMYINDFRVVTAAKVTFQYRRRRMRMFLSGRPRRPLTYISRSGQLSVCMQTVDGNQVMT